MIRDDDLLSIQEARDLVEKAYEASRQFLSFTQEQVDAIIDAMAQAATRAAEELAREAVEETGYGVVADKVVKNLFASQNVYQAIRPMKTVGLLREDTQNRILEIAVPVGVVAAILPTTNPTSTAIYKTLIALKGRNAIVISPHPNAIKCSCHTADLMYQAARQAGAPEHVIGCLLHPTMPGIQELMKHRRTGVILSTGGAGVVRAAYSSGKPAFGVGPGNVPAMVERTADVRKAVADVVAGKTFDNGTICSSEQALVAEESLRDQVIAELKANGACFLNDQEAAAVARVLMTPQFTANPKCAGKSAAFIAQTAGISVPAETRLLVAPLAGVGREFPLSAEKLSPVLALYFVKDFQEGMERCESLLRFGGLGHTIAIHSRDDARIREFGLRMPAFRVVVNSPATHGSVGFSTNLFPAMTLGCGTAGGNITGDNIGPQHLIQIRRVSYETRPVTKAARAMAAAAAPVIPRPAPAPPAPELRGPGLAVSTLTPDRQTIQRIVEQFLAQKGLPARPAANPLSPGPPPGVDLARGGMEPATCPGPAGICGPQPALAPPGPASTPSEIRKPPPPTVVDFVSESDVRAALNRSEKIHIGPRTIVTPAARDLAAERDVLVMTHNGTRPGKA